MQLDDLAHNINISEFASATGVPVATIRDWNKRELATGFGQPGPNRHWIYSRVDVVGVRIARVLYGDGFSWRTALFAASRMCSSLEARAFNPGETFYQGDYFAFVGWSQNDQIGWGHGYSFDEAVSNAEEPTPGSNVGARSPSAIVVKLSKVLKMVQTDGLFDEMEFGSN